AMFRRDGHRLTEAEREAVENAPARSAPFALVRDEDHRSLGSPQPAGELLIDRGDPDASVDDEQDQVGGLDRTLRLPPNGGLQSFVGARVEAGGIHHPKAEITETCVTLPPVARDAGSVVHNGEPPPDKAVEQRRFPDVRTTDDRYGRCHVTGMRPGFRCPTEHRAS